MGIDFYPSDKKKMEFFFFFFSPFHSLLETCRCPKILYTNYWSASPYLRVNRQDKKFGGILSNIVIDMIQVACDTCPEYGRTIVKTDSNGKGKDAFKKSLLGVLADIDNIPQISFPIYGNEYITRFMGSNVYINLVESPGLAFIAVKRMPGTAARNMISAVLDCAPLVVLSGCMAFIAGFIIWVLVSTIRTVYLLQNVKLDLSSSSPTCYLLYVITNSCNSAKGGENSISICHALNKRLCTKSASNRRELIPRRGVNRCSDGNVL